MNARGLLLLLAVLPPVLTAGLILFFGVNLPYWDEWVHLQTVVKFVDGKLTFADLFAQYNESRKVFPRLAIIGLNLTTGGDQRAQMMLSWVLACITTALLSVLARRTMPQHWTALTAMVSLLLFSWAQWQNWLWGIQFVCFVPLACLAGILLVTTPRPDAAPKLALRTGACAVLCVLATYSYANGMLLWPLAFVALVTMPGASQGRRSLVGFGIVAAVSIGAYFAAYQRPMWTPTLGDALADPVRLAGYFIVLIGGGFAPAELSDLTGIPKLVAPIALGVGVLLALGMCLPGALRQHRAAGRPWLILAAYGLVSLVIIASGRSPFGVENALLSRYATFSLPVAVATLAVVFLVGRRRVLLASCTVAIVFTVAASLYVLPRISDVSQRQRAGRLMLHFSLTAPDATVTTFVSDNAEHPLILPTAVRLSEAGLLRPPISATGDLRPLLTSNTDLQFDAIVAAVPQADGSLRVVRVLPYTHLPTQLPPLPPGSLIYGARGDRLVAFPLAFPARPGF